MFRYICFELSMKNLYIYILFLISTFSFSQIENNNRRIDIAPPKTKTILPNVTLVNPNAFTFKKEEKKDLPKGMMNQNNEYFLNPGDVYCKKIK